MLRPLLVTSLAVATVACGSDGTAGPARDGTSIEYADDWIAEAQVRCPSDDDFDACGFFVYALDDDIPASDAPADNFGMRYFPSEDIDGVGWEFLGQFAAAIGCEMPDDAPTEIGEVDCSPT